MAGGFELYIQALKDRREAERQQYVAQEMQKEMFFNSLAQAGKGIGSAIGAINEAKSDTEKYKYLAGRPDIQTFNPQEFQNIEPEKMKEVEKASQQIQELEGKISGLDMQQGKGITAEATGLYNQEKKDAILNRIKALKERVFKKTGIDINAYNPDQYKQTPEYKKQLEEAQLQEFTTQNPIGSRKYHETMDKYKEIELDRQLRHKAEVQRSTQQDRVVDTKQEVDSLQKMITEFRDIGYFGPGANDMIKILEDGIAEFKNPKTQSQASKDYASVMEKLNQAYKQAEANEKSMKPEKKKTVFSKIYSIFQTNKPSTSEVTGMQTKLKNKTDYKKLKEAGYTDEEIKAMGIE